MARDRPDRDAHEDLWRDRIRMPNDLAARALSADDGTSRADYFDANLTQPIPDGVLAGDFTQHFLIHVVGADVIDPDAKLSYADEWLAGIEREVWLLADIFNLFNTQTVTMYDQWTELTGPVPNPDFGAPITQ